jgi:dihydrofolate reductase
MSIKFIAIAAVTLDGKIAKGPSHMSNWTSKEDKVFLHGMLDKCDCIIVGNNTYKTAVKPLSKRNCIVLTRAVPPSPPEGRAGERLQYCNPSKTDLKKLIRDHKFKTITVLGGAQTYSFCLQNNLLDELYLTVEPIAFGKGISLFTDEAKFDKKFKLISIKKLNEQGSLLLRYKNR